MKLIPLKYVDAANPPISVRTPPPKLINRDFLSALKEFNWSQIEIHDSIFLLLFYTFYVISKLFVKNYQMAWQNIGGFEAFGPPI